eukprot:g1584.t1
MTATTELQDLIFPAAAGSVAMVLSCIQTIFMLNKPRYKLKNFKHPYAPWKKPQSDPKVYRGWKAGENCREWLLYVLPCYWTLILFASTLPMLTVGETTIDLATFVPWIALLSAFGYAEANVAYVKGYMSSTEERMPGFKRRTLFARFFLYGSILTLGCYVARRYGGIGNASIPFLKFE